MQKKIPFPKNGILVLGKSMYIYGQGDEWKSGKHIHTFYFIKRYEKCEGTSNKKCGMRSTFYGYETIGPRVYSVHKCIMGHVDRTRLIEENSSELAKHL